MLAAKNRQKAQVILNLLAQKRSKLVVAESCTGGLLGATLTAIPGSSETFLGGYITYANAAKIQLLGVSESLLAQHGAVSEEVALAMAEGALRQLAEGAQANVAVAITGIAGPGGSTRHKPVGLVYMAGLYSAPTSIAGGIKLAAGQQRHLGKLVIREIFEGERGEVREKAVYRSLELLAELLQAGSG